MATQEEQPRGGGGSDTEPKVTESPRPYQDGPRTRDDVDPWDDIEVTEVVRPVRDFSRVGPLSTFRSTTAFVREQRHLSVDCPSRVVVNVPFQVAVSLALTMRGRASLDLGLLSIPLDGMAVTVVVSANQPVQMEAPGTQRATLLPGQDLDFRFTIAALAATPLELDVRVFAEGAFLGEVSVPVSVSGSAIRHDVSNQNVAAEFEVGVPVPGSATLSIDYHSVSKRYKFGLSIAGGMELWADLDEALSTDLTPMAEQITHTLDALARGVMSPKLTENYLRNIGSVLWAEGVPKAIRDALLGQGDLRRLTLVSRGDLLPWEMIWSEGFLADRWRITRWLHGMGTPSLKIGMGQANYVLPSNAPTRARAEIDAISRFYPPAGANWSTVDELVAGIELGTFGILHIAAHNTATHIPEGAYISLDQPFDQMLLMGPAMAGRMAARKPLVFVNACGSAAAAQGWYGVTSWADRFVKAGAGAFIGSMWEIRDQSASPFAEAFYEATRLGLGLEDAFQTARLAINNPGDPTRLAYALYGHPDARLSIT